MSIPITGPHARIYIGCMQPSFRPRAVTPIRLVHVSFFRPNYKASSRSRKVKARDRNLCRLAVSQHAAARGFPAAEQACRQANYTPAIRAACDKVCAFCVQQLHPIHRVRVSRRTQWCLEHGRCLLRVSQRTICPEYVPPKTRFALKGEKATERTSD